MSQTAVQKAIREDRIQILPGKKIDVGAADRAWAENSSPLPPPNASQPEAPSGEEATAAASFAASRARKEAALADMREYDLAQKLGQLVTVEDMITQLAACLDAVASPLRSLAPRIIRELARAGVLKPNVDGKARNVIEIEIDRILEELQQAGERIAIDGNDAAA